MKMFFLIVIAAAFYANAQQVYTNDMVQPSDAIILHSSDSAANGKQKLAYDLKGFCLLPNSDSAVIYYNPRWATDTTIWIPKWIAKGSDVGALTRRINWTLTTVDSLIGYKRQQ
jgi:hypothetical protein